MKPFFLSLTILASFTNACFAQELPFTYQNGKIKVEDKLFCLYKEIDIENINQGSREKEFKDVAFYTNDTLPVIYMEARALSVFNPSQFSNAMDASTISATNMIQPFMPGINRIQVVNNSGIPETAINSEKRKMSLLNYYRIEFSPLQKEVNILYHKETLFAFMKDLVWYQVFVNGQFNEKGAEKLIKKWENKEIDYLPFSFIEKGVDMGYKSEYSWKKSEWLLYDIFRIDYEQKKIYRHDTLIGSFYSKEMPEGTRSGVAYYYIPHYYISDKDGNFLSEIYSNEKASYAIFNFPEGKQSKSLMFPLVDKSEQKQVAVAIDVLLQMGKLQ